jgi:serine protease inhibitor
VPIAAATIALAAIAAFGVLALPAAGQRTIAAGAADRAECEPAAAQAKLAFALIEKLANRNGMGTVSLASLASAFGIISLGADAPMKAAIAKALGFAPQRAEAGLAALAEVRGKLANAGDTFRSASRIVFAPSSPQNKILQAALENLGIDYAIADLSNSEAAAKIDAWVEEATSRRDPGNP